MNSLVVLAVIVSLATLVMLGINVYLILQNRNERGKNQTIQNNIVALSSVIHGKLQQKELETTLTSSEDTANFLINIEKDLIKISEGNKIK